MNAQTYNLTIVLPVLKTEYLNECVNSLSSSTNVGELNIELIVINVGNLNLTSFQKSSQLSINIFDMPGANYKDAVIYGVSKSKSNLIALMNDDDLVHPDRLNLQYKNFSKFSIDLVITNMKTFGQYRKRISLNPQPNMLFHPRYLWLGPYGANATWMFRKSWFEKFVHDNLEGNNFDWRFALISFNTSSIVYESRKLYFYRQHRDQITRNSNYRVELAIEMIEILRNEISGQLQFTPSLSGVTSLAFPYLRNKVTHRTIYELLKISRTLLTSKQTLSVWLIYQLFVRFVCAFYWWTKGDR